MRSGRLLLLVILAAFSGAVSAQTDEPSEPPPLGPIVTDRPTQATSPTIEPRHVFQLEAGYERTGTAKDGSDVGEWTLPNLLLRYGVSRRFEVRLGTVGWVTESGPDGTERGFTDICLSTKILLVEERGALPQMGLLVDLGLPLGDNAFTSDTVSPTVTFLAYNNLTDRLTLTYNLGAGLVTTEVDGGTEKEVGLGWAAVLSGSVGGPFSLFGEFYGDFASGHNSENSLAFQAGSTVLLSRRFQIDFRGGVGLAGDEPDWLFGVGLAYRMPR